MNEKRVLEIVEEAIKKGSCRNVGWSHHYYDRTYSNIGDEIRCIADERANRAIINHEAKTCLLAHKQPMFVQPHKQERCIETKQCCQPTAPQLAPKPIIPVYLEIIPAEGVYPVSTTDIIDNMNYNWNGNTKRFTVRQVFPVENKPKPKQKK